MLRIMTLLAIAMLVLVGSAIAEPIQWTVEEGGNGHWYELVQLTVENDWCYLQNMADEQTHLGMPGYLVTITSQEEQNWIFTQYGCELSNWIAMGFYQISNVPNVAWVWITGETWDYTNWDVGEPNNHTQGGGGEYMGMFSRLDCDGEWNDYCNYPELTGYVVEFGGFDPISECPPGEPPGQPILSEQSSWGAIKKAYR